MKTAKKFPAAILAFLLIVSLFLTAVPVYAVSGPSLKTTLSDNIEQRGSRRTFDVWARNASGDKIKATVKFNGQKLNPTWDDNDKASYTLVFTREGKNIVTVSAASDGGQKKQLTYHINYKKAKPGEKIGTAIWSVEMFTIGCGYLIEPVEVPIYEGENAAEQLVRLLHDHGFVAYYGGKLTDSFYIGYVADGDSGQAVYNNYRKSGTTQKPKKLNIHPNIPSVLTPHLEETMSFFDPDEYETKWKGHLGEFVMTNGSGWMYSINNIFPNVGFADSYPAPGDIVRVQFTMGYGADIGGSPALGTEIPGVDVQPESGYFDVADKDALTKEM